MLFRASALVLVALLVGCQFQHDESTTTRVDPRTLAQPRGQETAVTRSPASSVGVSGGTTGAAPAGGAVGAGPAGGAAPRVSGGKYQIGVFAFQIYNTRSRHNDTVYVTCDASVDGHKLPAASKAMGNLNNGIYDANCYLPAVDIYPDSTVIFNYSLVNAGHGDPSQVQKALTTGADQALDQSGLGEPWKSIAKAAIALGNTLFFANCDGPLTGEQITLRGSDIIHMASVGHPYTSCKLFQGSDTPSGCGSNSKYDTTWAIVRVQ